MSAVTAPLTTLAILGPAMATPARDAARATYAMHGAAETDVLEDLRASAVAASDRLVDAATELFAAHGGTAEVTR